MKKFKLNPENPDIKLIYKAIDILKKAGVTKNFTPNYLDGLSPSAYADLYTKIHISPKITNYRLE